MGRVDQSRRRLAKSLKRARQKHARVLAQVEKAQARVEKRKNKLQRLEAKIADAEVVVSELQKTKSGQVADRAGGLRPAQLIVNPQSGPDGADHSEQLAEIVTHLREHGISANVGSKSRGQVADDIAKEAVGNGDDLIIAVGGDGTVEQVASRMIGSDKTLGIIPIGAHNNLARSLGIPLTIQDACALIGMGATRSVDAGRLVSGAEGKTEYFLEAAGVGLSAVAMLAGDSLEKNGWEALPSSLLKLFDAQPGAIEIEIDGQVIQAKTQIVTISNAPLFGPNVLVAPDAKMDDGLLDVAIYEGMTKTDLLDHFRAASDGARVQNPNVKFFRARHVRINSEAEADANSDQKVFADRRLLEVEVVPHALAVIVGKGTGLSLPVESAPAVPAVSASKQPAPEMQGSNNGHGDAEQN